MLAIGLILLGIAVGVFGTLIGAGGGFILVPILLLLYPTASPETITAISLAVVFFNAASGSLAYAKMGRIDYRSGWIFAAVTVPGAVLGALTTNLIPRDLFNITFGLLMIMASLYLLLKQSEIEGNAGPDSGRWVIHRSLVERNGEQHRFSYDLRPGVLISAAVGYISSLLGIGGGIIHVPALHRLLRFPVHIATATSHFILAIMALAGTLVHFYTGAFSHGGLHRTLWIGIGALIGAQGGALLARRVHGSWIMKSLAIALGVAGLRIALLSSGH